jgi:hypothetical protein
VTWSRGYSQSSSSTEPFFTLRCCDRLLPHRSLLHFQTLSTQCATFHMDKHLVTCRVQCLAALKFIWKYHMPISRILPELPASGQQWWFNTLHIVVYTCASRLHHNWQPITGSHTLLFSVLISQTDPPAVNKLLLENFLTTTYWNTFSPQASQ